VAALVAGAGMTAGPADAAPRWSATKAYDLAPRSCLSRGSAVRCLSEPAPRVAVAPGGAAVAAWVDGTRGGDRLRVAVAGRAGRFGRAVTLDRSALRPSPAIARDGAVTVVWAAAHDRLRFARRPAGSARFGVARTLARDADDAHAVARPDGSVVVVYESRGAMKAITIAPDGAPGAARALGRGGFGHDTVRAGADGTLAACCVTPVNDDPNVPADTADKIAVHRAGGWTLVSADGLGAEDAIESVFATAGELVAGVVRVHTGGDAGVLGEPGLVRVAGPGPLPAPQLVRGVRPTRGLAPSATIDAAGRGVLVYQEKSRSDAFSRTAPVYAAVAAAGAPALAVRQRLDVGEGYEPAVRPFGAGALAAWQRGGERWGVAIERAGRFRAAPAPPGRGPSGLGEDFHYNHDLATSGRFAVLAWTGRDGGIRVSELTG
jgi:hypothetical protein